MTDGVLIDRHTNGVVVLTLNDPEHRNPMSGPKILDPLIAALRAVESDPTVRALVLTGAGSCFSAGGNLHEMRDKAGMFQGRPATIAESYLATVQQLPLILSRIDVPTIAAVNGPAFGAGCDLSLMCDMRIASNTARFGEVFVDLGLVSGDGGGWFLVRHLGYQRAAEISFRARPVDAQEALELGLVLSLHATEELMPATLEFAAEIAAKSAPAIRMTKRLLRMAERSHLQDYLAAVAAMQALAHGTDEHADKVAAALETRRR